MTALQIMTKACDEAKILYRIEKWHSTNGTTYQTLEFIESFDGEMYEMCLNFLNGTYVPDKDLEY